MGWCLCASAQALAGYLPACGRPTHGLTLPSCSGRVRRWGRKGPGRSEGHPACGFFFLTPQPSVPPLLWLDKGGRAPVSTLGLGAGSQSHHRTGGAVPAAVGGRGGAALWCGRALKPRVSISNNMRS